MPGVRWLFAESGYVGPLQIQVPCAPIILGIVEAGDGRWLAVQRRMGDPASVAFVVCMGLPRFRGQSVIWEIWD